MALNLTSESCFGVKIYNAYFRINNIELKSKTNMLLHVYGYAFVEKKPFDYKVIDAPYDLEKGNPFEQGYIYLKTLPEFADAVDC